MGKDTDQESDIKQKSNTKLKYFCVFECGVVILYFCLSVVIIMMFFCLKNTLVDKFKERDIEQDDSYFATDVRNLDLDIKDGDDFSFNYKKEVVEKNDNLNVQKIWILVCLVALFLILLLFLFFSVNRIYDSIALHKKLYFLNEKYEDAVERYGRREEAVYEKQITGKDKNDKSVTSEKKYPDMKELFKVYSNALLEL